MNLRVIALLCSLGVGTLLAGCANEGPAQKFQALVEKRTPGYEATTDLPAHEVDFKLTILMGNILPRSGPISKSQFELSCSKQGAMAFWHQAYSQYVVLAHGKLFNSQHAAYREITGMNYSPLNGTKDSKGPATYWFQVSSMAKGERLPVGKLLDTGIACQENNSVRVGGRAYGLYEGSLDHLKSVAEKFNLEAGGTEKYSRAEGSESFLSKITRVGDNDDQLLYVGYSNASLSPEMYRRILATAQAVAEWTYNPFNAEEIAVQTAAIQAKLSAMQITSAPRVKAKASDSTFAAPVQAEDAAASKLEADRLSTVFKNTTSE